MGHWGCEGSQLYWIAHDAHLRSPTLSPRLERCPCRPACCHQRATYSPGLPLAACSEVGSAGGFALAVSQIPALQWTRHGPQLILPATCWAIPWGRGRASRGGRKSPPAPPAAQLTGEGAAQPGLLCAGVALRWTGVILLWLRKKSTLMHLWRLLASLLMTLLLHKQAICNPQGLRFHLFYFCQEKQKELLLKIDQLDGRKYLQTLTCFKLVEEVWALQEWFSRQGGKEQPWGRRMGQCGRRSPSPGQGRFSPWLLPTSAAGQGGR